MNKNRVLLAAIFCAGLTPAWAQAADVTVMISGGFFSSFKALVPGFEAQTGDHVITPARPVHGHHAQCHPGAPGARRAG